MNYDGRWKTAVLHPAPSAKPRTKAPFSATAQMLRAAIPPLRALIYATPASGTLASLSSRVTRAGRTKIAPLSAVAAASAT